MPTIDPQTGASSGSIYDPTLPSRIARGGAALAQQPPIATTEPGQGPQYNPSFGSDTSPNAASGLTAVPVTTGINAPISPWGPQPDAGAFRASFNANAPGISSVLGQAVKGNYLNRYLGNLDASGAPYPMRGAARSAVATPAGVNRIFSNLPDDTFNGAGGGGNAVTTAQAPASATPQGWNLFAAIGQALGHLLGYNAQGQPQGMTGLIRNPVQTAPAQTAALRMPTQLASRYQGRTLVG